MKFGFENLAIAEIKKICGKYNLNPIDLSMHINVIPVRIYEILRGKRRVTVDTDLRLCKFFKLEDGHFMNLQILYDFEVEKNELGDKLDEIKTVDEVVLKKKI